MMSYKWNMLPIIAVAFAGAPLVSPLAAQNAAPVAGRDAAVSIAVPVTRDAPAQSAGAARIDGVVGVRARPAVIATMDVSPAPVPAANGRSVTMMIVGGAALVVGAVVGGDSGNVIMVGGAVIGLIGLWNYLK